MHDHIYWYNVWRLCNVRLGAKDRKRTLRLINFYHWTSRELECRNN